MPEDDAPIGIQEWVQRKGLNAIELQPIYLDCRNEIVAPEKVTLISQYFLDKWAPILGPTLTLLIIRLRRYCYFNKLTKERRDWCYPKHENLAAEIGVSRWTILRELQRPIAHSFVKREKRYVYDPATKKTVRTSDMYYIAMDDPLIPDDQSKLKILVQQRTSGAKTEEENRQENRTVDLSSKLLLRSQNPGGDRPPKWQFATQVRCSNLLQEDVLLRSTFKNVNVNANLPDLSEDEMAREAQIQGLATEMAETLHDPQSTGYYRFLAGRILEAYGSPQLIFRALSETKDEARRGRIRRSKGAYFVDLIKRYCAEHGINLKP
ncbi:MAG: hypothetical protein AB1898_30975 [Acidobacteriota bacterium]